MRREWHVYCFFPERDSSKGTCSFLSLTLTGAKRGSSSQFRGWIDDLLKTSWEACQGTDVLVESPSAMGGIHIAEALRIPYFRAFTMPWTRTRAYPHAFGVPDRKVHDIILILVIAVGLILLQMGGGYNYMVELLCCCDQCSSSDIPLDLCHV